MKLYWDIFVTWKYMQLRGKVVGLGGKLKVVKKGGTLASKLCTIEDVLCIQRV
jgi:hypothetical protein